MADTKISALTSISSVDATADFIPIVDTSDTQTKKSTRNTFLNLSSTPLGTTDTQSPTNKTFDSSNTFTIRDDRLTLQDNADTTKQAQFQLSGITTGTTRTYTLPNASTTLVGTDATQTLTNKTLTSPTINTATIANPTLTVDSIAEFTATAGVTIDGMLIKDNTVGPGTITPAGLVAGTGSSWVLQNWTPTWTNLTIGNATTVYKYTQIGKTVHFSLAVTLGSTSAVGTNPIFTLPVTSTPVYATAQPMGYGRLTDAGTLTHPAAVLHNSTTSAYFVTYDANSTFVRESVPSATNPFTWTTADVIQLYGTYEAA